MCPHGLPLGPERQSVCAHVVHTSPITSILVANENGEWGTWSRLDNQKTVGCANLPVSPPSSIGDTNGGSAPFQSGANTVGGGQSHGCGKDGDVVSNAKIMRHDCDI